MTTIVVRRKLSLLISILVRIITPLSAVILIPIFVSNLTKEEYGIWFVILGLVNYLGLANFGIAQTVANEVAKLHGRGGFDEISCFVSTAWTLYLKIVVTLAFIVVICVVLYAWQQWQTNYSVFLIMALSFLLAMPFKLFSVSLRSFEHIQDEQAIQVITIVLRTLLVFGLLLSGIKLLGLAVVYGVMNWFPLVLAKFRLQYLYPAIRVTRGLYDTRYLKHIFSHSSSFFVIQIAGLIAFSTDNLVIAYFLGPESVPDYAIPAQMILMAQGLITTLAFIFYPMVSRYFAINNLEPIREMYLSVMYAQLAVGTMIFVVLYLNGVELLFMLAGPSIQVENSVLLLLLIYFMVQLVMSLSNMIVMATSNHKWMAYIGPLEAFVNLVLSIWWVQLWGVAGVVAATIVGRICVTSFYIQYKAVKLLEMKHRDIIQTIMRSAIAGFLTTVGLLYLLNTAYSDLQAWKVLIVLTVSLVALFTTLGRSYISSLFRLFRTRPI